MIRDRNRYREIEKKEKIEYLSKLTPQKAGRHLEEIVEFGWPFVSKNPRPYPVTLKLLLKKH